MKKHLQRNRLKKLLTILINGIQMAKKFKLGERILVYYHPSPRQCINQVFGCKSTEAKFIPSQVFKKSKSLKSIF